MTCEDIDECQDVNACLVILSRCRNTPGSFRCECLDGYTSVFSPFTNNLIACEQIDNCANSETCLDPFLCENVAAGGINCYCPPGLDINTKQKFRHI